MAPPPTLRSRAANVGGPFRRVPRLWDLLKALSLVEGLPCPDFPYLSGIPVWCRRELACPSAPRHIRSAAEQDHHGASPATRDTGPEMRKNEGNGK